MPANQGLEALAVIRAGPLRGSLVAFAERFTRGSGYHTGWIWVGGTPHRLQLRDIDGFNITDAAGLPDGGLLVLERYFRWTTGVSMRIRRLQPAEIRPGARLTGRIVFQGDSGYEIDNMEGMAVHRAAARRDGGIPDLRRQLQPPLAANRVPAVHAGRHEPRPAREGVAPVLLRDRLLGLRLRHGALQLLAAVRERFVLRLHQEGVEAAGALDRSSRRGR